MDQEQSLLSTRIDAALHKKLREFVKRRGLKLCFFVESAIREALKEGK